MWNPNLFLLKNHHFHGVNPIFHIFPSEIQLFHSSIPTFLMVQSLLFYGEIQFFHGEIQLAGPIFWKKMKICNLNRQETKLQRFGDQPKLKDASGLIYRHKCAYIYIYNIYILCIYVYIYIYNMYDYIYIYNMYDYIYIYTTCMIIYIQHVWLYIYMHIQYIYIVYTLYNIHKYVYILIHFIFICTWILLNMCQYIQYM